MIKFEECPHRGYRPRTEVNASADVTLAIATDFNTAGERLTKSCCTGLYISIELNKLNEDSAELAAVLIDASITKDKWTLNIAGNGIYTLHDSQEDIDSLVFTFLWHVFKNLKTKPSLIRSGGQTGIDEAGLKAAVKLGIPALCYAPNGWGFRNKQGIDIWSEKQFKARFK